MIPYSRDPSRPHYLTKVRLFLIRSAVYLKSELVKFLVGSNVLGSYNASMPECTYLVSVTSPPGLLPLSVTQLLCINSSGSVLHYQYPTTDYMSPSTPLALEWGENRNALPMPNFSGPPPYVEKGGNSMSGTNRTIISLFWRDSCGYDMVFPSDVTSGFAHYLGIWGTCGTTGGSVGSSDKWEFRMLVPTSGEATDRT